VYVNGGGANSNEENMSAGSFYCIFDPCKYTSASKIKLKNSDKKRTVKALLSRLLAKSLQKQKSLLGSI
jgi:hypothetical protein